MDGSWPPSRMFSHNQQSDCCLSVQDIREGPIAPAAAAAVVIDYPMTGMITHIDRTYPPPDLDTPTV